MIEVEKKFFLNPEDIPKIIDGAQFIEEVIFDDTYLDTPDYLLTLHDKWLRLRDDKFQLKYPLPNGQYEDIVTDEQIKLAVGIKSDDPLFTALKKHGFISYCHMLTNRKKYKKDGFIIDLDHVDDGFDIGEIEFSVDYASLVSSAEVKIQEFASRNGLILLPVRAKIYEYLKRHNPDLYRRIA
jgi:adenylate cyclase class IV